MYEKINNFKSKTNVLRCLSVKLHELLPSVFSCLLSKQLCARPEIDNHYALREYCARLVGQVLKYFNFEI